MPVVDLSLGEISYSDSGGEGPTVVFLHGVNMSGTVWRKVVDHLGTDVRCLCPTLPLGSHLTPMRHPEKVTHRGVSALVGDFLEALELRDVVLVLNDWGGAQFLLADGPTERLAGAALVAVEAFDNFPPGRPGKAVATSARVPGMLWAAMQLQRFRWFRRAPGAWGWMAKHPVDDDVMDEWFAPAQRSAAIRRDLRTFALSTPSRSELAALADRLTQFTAPVQVVWAREDKMMPLDHGSRLAATFPDSRLAIVDDSYTVIPQDQPERLAEILRDFVREVQQSQA